MSAESLTLGPGGAPRHQQDPNSAFAMGLVDYDSDSDNSGTDAPSPEPAKPTEEKVRRALSRMELPVANIPDDQAPQPPNPPPPQIVKDVSNGSALQEIPSLHY